MTYATDHEFIQARDAINDLNAIVFGDDPNAPRYAHLVSWHGDDNGGWVLEKVTPVPETGGCLRDRVRGPLPLDEHTVDLLDRIGKALHDAV